MTLQTATDKILNHNKSKSTPSHVRVVMEFLGKIGDIPVKMEHEFDWDYRDAVIICLALEKYKSPKSEPLKGPAARALLHIARAAGIIEP